MPAVGATLAGVAPTTASTPGAAPEAAMRVLFVAPEFPHYQREFVRGLKQAGAWVTGIGERPLEWLDADLRSWMDQYEQIGSVCHEGELLAAVQRCQARGWVDRLESTIEAHILPVAKIREATGIPGLTYKAAWLCRDKPAMKEFLRQAGIPCARSTAADSAAEVRAFAAEVGYPLILKPRAGAGADGTTRVNNDKELARALKAAGFERGVSIAVEEFIEGHEGFYDTLTIRGEVTYEFVSHYYPNVLEAMRQRDVAPVIVHTNRSDLEGYAELRDLGRRVVAALGLGTTATHMEWFYGPKGLKFSEIGARPPGVGQWDLYAAANDIDIYREWANAIVHGKVSRAPSRRYASGIVALRPERDGTIRGYEGLDQVRQLLGPGLIDFHLPPPGSPTRPIEGGYMANAWIRARHPDYDELRAQLARVGEIVKVRAG